MPIHLHQACEVLGVHPNDPDLEGSARRAYRQLVKQAHPDKGGTTEEFTMIDEAYRAIKQWIENPPQPGFAFGGMHVHAPQSSQVYHHPNGSVTITITTGPINWSHNWSRK